METRHQAEQADPHQHVQPPGAFANHGFHRLGQRVVDVRQGAPVADATGEEHHAHRQQHQGQNTADVGLGNGAFRVLGFFGGHGGAFDGQEEPDGKGDGREHSGDRRSAEHVGAGPAIEGEVAKAERRRDHAHEHQQFSDRQHADHQFEGRRQFHAEDVETHEQDIGTDCRVFRVQGWKLDIEIGADGQGNRRWGEDEFDQCRQAGDQSAFFPKRTTAVGKGASSVRNGGGQLGETEDEAGVQGGDHERGHQKTQGPGHAPAITPAEILPGNHQPDGNAPQMQRAQRGFELCVHALAP
ncbi:hypothetical protein D3C75_751230 [compost metagenome]